ncbi:MAG: 4Fe-4S binding protein [Desulfitobacterium hafniense]|nr:4Fe-4S binding protein [Desulfitobacterium hafniense]
MNTKINMNPKMNINMKKTAWWLRMFVLVGLLVYVTYESYMHQVLGGGKAPSVHALCPLGALESLYTLLFMESFIQKIYSGTVVLLVLTIILALLFRRSFCGLLCPFGALQEVFARLGIKIFKKRLVIPQVADRPLRYLKYVILVLTVGMAWYYGKLWMSPYDPYTAYAHITTITESIAEDPLTIVGFILLGITLLGSLLYDRFFCKYLCPAGAFYGLIGKLSPTKVVRNDDICIHCKVCNKACPVNIDVEKADKITDTECISCNECVLACPKNGALEVKVVRKTLHPLPTLLIVAGLFFGTIFVAQATGNYQIIPSALKEGEIIAISEVKGYYSIEETALATGLSLKEVYEKFGIPENVSKHTKMKDISKEVPKFNLDTAKEEADSGESKAVEPATLEAPEGSSKVDISNIKGSMTIRDASATLKMDVKEFYKLFMIPEDVPAQTQMKSIEGVSPGYNFEKVKALLKQ